jgi:hypothetical protein
VPGPAGLAADDRGQGLELAAAERRLALDREPQGRPQRPQVGGRADRRALDLLRCHVGGRADHQARGGQPRVPLDGGDAEVGQLGGAVRAHHDVLRLEVAVDDAGPVGGLQGGQQVQAKPGGPLRGQRPVAPDQVVQGGRDHQLHHDVVVVAVLRDVVDGDRPRVAEAGGRPRLPRHPRAHGGPLLGVEPAWQVDLLDRHLAGQQRVGRPPDHAHAAAAELGAELVAVGNAPPGAVRGHRRERYRPPGRQATTATPVA